MGLSMSRGFSVMTFSIHVPNSVFGSIVVPKISRGFRGSAPEQRRGVGRKGHAFGWGPDRAKLLRSRAQVRLEAADAEPRHVGLHPVDDARALPHDRTLAERACSARGTNATRRSSPLVLRSGSMPRRCSAVSRERRSLALWRQSGVVWRFSATLVPGNRHAHAPFA
jgi:hypothetical protein